MDFQQVLSYLLWIAIIAAGFSLIKLILAWIDRVEAKSEYDRAHAALEEAQAQQIRSRLHHFEVHGGILFFYDGGEHGEPPIPYIKVGPATEADTVADPEPAPNPDLVTAKKLVDLSLAKFTGSGNRLVTYEESGLDHNAHSSAVKWLASQGVVWSNNGGVFCREMSLAGLKLWLAMAEAVGQQPPARRVWTAG